MQLAAAEGSAKNWDFWGIGGLLGSGFGAVGGGYSNTAEGKVIVAAFMDSYNGVAKAVQGAPAPQARVQTMTVAQVQAKLNPLGYPVGRADGIMGRRRTHS